MLAEYDGFMPRLESMIQVPGGRLHTVVDGDGPPVVLLHAGIADLRAWDAMVPPLVDAGFRVIRFDMRGLGSSQTDDVEFARYRDALAVMDALGVGRAPLVGNSIGGMTALDMALESPERVVALVLVASGIGGFDGGDTADELAVGAAMEAADESADADLLNELEIQFWVDGVGQPTTRVDPAIRQLMLAMNRPSCDPDHIGGRPIALEPPANERLGTLTVPTLAIAGALDASSQRATLDRIAASVPGARTVTLPGVAHMIGMEQPEILAALVLEHIHPLLPWG